MAGKHRKFGLKPYRVISNEVQALASLYPEFVTVYTAQERFGLSSPGICGDAPCLQWVLQITDKATLDQDIERPEVFFSGCLHGNERVGPTAVIEAAWLLVKAAKCVADATSDACNDPVLASNPDRIPWLARIARTRNIIMMPMTNAKGYSDDVREENGIDPNRDFPYHNEPSQCMQTITARAVNEVWREHIFQLSITFHGGMVAIAYEWGDMDHPAKGGHDHSPDDWAQKQIGSGLSIFAGGFTDGIKSFAAYPVSTMNSLVYAVAGGMEDWSYAGSWDGPQVQCTPNSFGGYDSQRTMYDDATLRAFNMLVETSDQKDPVASSLGGTADLFDPHSPESGHVARNIRLALMMADIVQPHVAWSINLEDTVDSLTSGPRVFHWQVQGAFSADTTWLYFGKWPRETSVSLDESEGFLLDEASKAELDRIAEYSSFRTPDQSGAAYWGSAGSLGSPTEDFTAELDFSKLTPGEYFVIAAAIVDQSWSHNSDSVYPSLPPQSHVVNARTNPSWSKSIDGRKVNGRLNWYSLPISITIPEGRGGTSSYPEGEGATISPLRVDPSPTPAPTPAPTKAAVPEKPAEEVTPADVNPKHELEPSKPGADQWMHDFGVAAALLGLLLLGFAWYLRRVRRKIEKGDIIPELSDEEGGPREQREALMEMQTFGRPRPRGRLDPVREEESLREEVV